ncbi:MAG: PP2C family protein-serine/threonine phosphatase [Phycisphaerales bacterium]
MRVLIAEDERITRTTLARQLERWGHEVVATENGREAWERLQEDRFDIVLTDWEMPELSGVELIKKIRGLEGRDYIYVILLTSRSDKGDIVSGIEAGADDYVSKPFDRGELRVRLLAGERVVQLERALKQQNEELRLAGERMRRDLEAASRVQRAMLPDGGVATDAVRAAHDYIPTDELAGDGLGFHLIDDRHLVAYVVDVTGHGVPAALLAVTAMHALSPAAGGLMSADAFADGAPDPAPVLAELNRRFSAGTVSSRFLTMILCVLDLQTGRLRFARAGHPLPVLVRAGRVTPVDDEGGLPLGILADAEYEGVELDLEPGDRIFLYSDGFTEQARSGGDEQFGDARLHEALLGDDGAAFDGASRRAIRALTDWAGGGGFQDDVSLVAIEWLGGAERA